MGTLVESRPMMNREINSFTRYISEHIYSMISTSAMLVSSIDVSGEEYGMQETSRTELGSYAHMPVAGRNAYVISDTGRIASKVIPFMLNYKKSTQISIVDAAVRYDCPFHGQTYLLVVQNILLVFPP